MYKDADTYFTDLEDALQSAGIAWPVMTLDLQRFNANIDKMMSMIPGGVGFRIPVKSLPCSQMIRHICERTGTDRVMTFNLQMLRDVSRSFPQLDQLLGKPLPVNALVAYLQTAPSLGASAVEKIQWLIDTPRRLEEYRSVAEARAIELRVNIEIDVGLHRGGIVPGTDLLPVLKTVADSPSLRFSGFMGYDFHLAKMPSVFGISDKAKADARRQYHAAVDMARDVFGPAAESTWTLNSAGSPTLALHDNMSVANDLTVGSALVKPGNFDYDSLDDFLPASFVATPVLKALDNVTLPGPGWLSLIGRVLQPKAQQTIFIHGGLWMADPVYPGGLSNNKIFGRSTNQEMLNGGRTLDLKPDDFVFLRPTQSEAVFLQFGDLAIYDDGQIVDHWPVYPASA